MFGELPGVSGWQPTHRYQDPCTVDGNPAGCVHRTTRRPISTLRLRHFGSWFCQTLRSSGCMEAARERAVCSVWRPATFWGSCANKAGVAFFFFWIAPAARVASTSTQPRRQIERFRTRGLLGNVVSKRERGREVCHSLSPLVIQVTSVFFTSLNPSLIQTQLFSLNMRKWNTGKTTLFKSQSQISRGKIGTLG